MTDAWGRLARVVQVVRPAALESLGSAQERALERHRRIALSAVVGLAAKLIVFPVNLLTVSLALNYLGAERYGAWVALSSFVLMLTFTDFGVGSALLNLVSQADGRNDRSAIVRYVSSAFIVMSVVAACLLLLFAAVYPLIDWPRLVGVSSATATDETGPALAVAFALFALGIPLAVAQRTQMAHQEGFAVSLWQAFGSLAGLLALLVVIRGSMGMIGVALALSGGVTLGALANYVAFFGRRPWLRPSRSAFSSDAARTVLRRGLLFVALQVAGSLAFVSDNLVADQVLGPEAAAQYSLAQRLYLLVPTLLSLAVMPLWPAFSEALARGDRAWVRTVFRRAVAACMLAAALGAAVLTLLREPVFSLWVGAEHVPSLPLALGLLVWATLYAWGGPVVVLLNAANVIKLQVVAALSMGVASVVLKSWLASVIGIEGIVWGNILAYGALTFIPYTIYFMYRSPLSPGEVEAAA